MKYLLARSIVQAAQIEVLEASFLSFLKSANLANPKEISESMEKAVRRLASHTIGKDFKHVDGLERVVLGLLEERQASNKE